MNIRPSILSTVLAMALAFLSCSRPLPSGVVGLDGHPLQIFAGDVPATVLIFVGTDCPISNRYAPEIQRLAAKYEKRGIRFWTVYVNPTEDVQAIHRHRSEFDYAVPAARDPEHSLVEMAEASVTPEAAVFDGDDQLVYSGRIDDRYIDFGKQRRNTRSRDLDEVLQAILEGQPIKTARTQAVGCYIADLKN